MQSRLVGLVALCLLLGGLAGCTTVSETFDAPTGSDGDHPFAGETVTVTVDGTDRERALVADGLAYWAENADQYAGFGVDFRVLDPGSTPADGPDVRVTFVETVTNCDGEYSAGCAPRLNASTSVDRPAGVQIQRGFANESTRLVVQHEIGHVLGLTHSDQPQSVMAHETTLATLPQPNATERAVPWNDSTVTVAIDNATVPADQRDAYADEVAYALAYIDEGADGTVPSNVTLQRVSDPSTADITVAVGADGCRESAGSCLSVAGTDPDRDGAIETYTSAEIRLVDLDTDTVSWHVARQLSSLFGTDALPDRLAEASASDRRGAWHG
jgi:hypothetical protein